MDKIAEILNRSLKAAITTLVAAMAGIVILNACGRYLFQMPLSWSAEIARYLMVWVAFLGAAILVHNNQHLRVDLWQKNISANTSLIRDTIIQSISLLFFSAITVYGFRFVIQSSGQATSSVAWLPMSAVYTVIPLSGFLMVLAAALRLRNLWTRERAE